MEISGDSDITDKSCFQDAVYLQRIHFKRIKATQETKATGADNLPPGMLKDCREHISQPLCHILNLSVKTARFPALWKVAKVVPIHKSGSYDRPENYRPISLLPVLSKIIEKAMHQQLINFLEKEDLLSKSQFGLGMSRLIGTADKWADIWRFQNNR